MKIARKSEGRLPCDIYVRSFFLKGLLLVLHGNQANLRDTQGPFE